MKLHEIENRNELPMAALLEVWESSARAMHHFLSDAEAGRIRCCT